jgi:hypothetical protein
MAIAKVLARDWKFYINSGTFAVPVWNDITCGINTFTFSNSKNDADTTDFCSDGYAESLVASRGVEISAEGFYLEDPALGDRSPGQEFVETLSAKTGNDSLGDFKLVSPGGLGRRFYASSVLADIGGGNDDPTTWGFTLTVSGKPVTI